MSMQNASPQQFPHDGCHIQSDRAISQKKRYATSLHANEEFENPLPLPCILLKDLLTVGISDPLWIIPGLLPEGVTLLAGKPKVGKSCLALDLALALAGPMSALGEIPTNQGDVLFLGLEDSLRHMYDRTMKQLQGRTIPENFFWSNTWSLLNDGGLADLEEWLETHPQARLIVIDTLAKVRYPRNNRGFYMEDYAIMMPLKIMAQAHHVAILVVYHLYHKRGTTDSMDDISIPTGFAAVTDCNMVLQRERGYPYAKLQITGRDMTEQTQDLSFDEMTARWTLTHGES